MTLPTGTITMNQVNVELGNPGTSNISLNDADVRDLAEIPSGTISMDDLRGKSAFSGVTATGGSTYIIPGYPGSDSPTGRFKVHVFTGSGTFVVSNAPPSAPNVTYWITSGGGAGGLPSTHTLGLSNDLPIGFSGGGGGGGLRSGSTPVSVTSYPVTVGSGGALTRNPSPPSPAYVIRAIGSRGNPSSALGVSIAGGGTPDPQNGPPSPQVTSGGAMIFSKSSISPETISGSSNFDPPWGNRGAPAYGYFPNGYNSSPPTPASRKITYVTQSGGGGGAGGSPFTSDGYAIYATKDTLDNPAFPPAPTPAPPPTFLPAFTGTVVSRKGNGKPGGDIDNVPAPTIAPAIPSPQRPAWISATTNGSDTRVGGGGGGSGFYSRKDVDIRPARAPKISAQLAAESIIASNVVPNVPTMGLGANGGGNGRLYFTPSLLTPPAPSGANINRHASAGIVNTGGGGGGMNWNVVGVLQGVPAFPTGPYTVPWPPSPSAGNGGSGIVVIGYPTI